MSQITQPLTPFDTNFQPTEGSSNFRERAGYSWNWLIEHTNQQNILIQQINVVVGEVNTNAQQVSQDKQTVLEAKDIAVQAKEAAVIAKNEAQAIYDNFDDRYLGAKTTPPTVDNDGNPLTSGALYYNSSNDSMYVYDLELGSWIDLSYVPTLLSSLTDILFSGLADGDILKYDATLGKWKNIPRDYYLKSETYNKTELDLKISTQQFDKPSKGPLFIKVSPSSIKIPAGLKLTVGAESFKVVSDYTLTLASNLLVPETKTAGTDYYVYAKSDATFYISSNENITTDRQIGGSHYGLVGETEAATGNKTEADMVKIRGINAYSFWDLKYRPTASPKGMVNIGKKWYDIYLLNSEHITNGTSKAGATIAAGATTNGRAIPKIPLEYGGNGTITYGKFTWFQACEIAKAHNKQLISYAEFPTIAYGVTEGVSSSTNGYETVAGKIEHYPHLTSKYGIEQAAGVEWIWGSDLANGYGTTDFAWKDNTDGRGQIYSTSNSPTAVILGGDRVSGVFAGSRASGWHTDVWNSVWAIGCRFACDHLELE